MSALIKKMVSLPNSHAPETGTFLPSCEVSHQIFSRGFLGDQELDQSKIFAKMEKITPVTWKSIEQRPEQIGHLVEVPPSETKKLIPEGIGGQMRDSESLQKNPVFLYRDSTAEVINRLTQLKEGGFSQVGSSSSTVYVDGLRSAGKSSTVAQAVIWARANDWLVFYINDGKEWVDGGNQIVASSYMEGNYNQVSINEGETGPAVPLLKNFVRAHEDKLGEIPVRLKHSGLEGFDPETHKTLLDLGKLGIKTQDETLSCDVVCALRAELNTVVEYPVLVAVDGYSVLEGRGIWVDPVEIILDRAKYKKHPPMDCDRLALTSAVQLHEDGSHGLVNGAYVVSREDECGKRSVAFMERSGAVLFDNPVVVQPYSIQESRKILEYYISVGLMETGGEVTDKTFSFIHQLNGGLAGEVCKYARMIDLPG